MPIEIRELVIKARVEDAAAAKSGNSNGTPPTLTDRDWQKMVARCTEEVLKVLKKQTER